MKNKDETRRFETVTLGLPPLKMILVETEPEPRRKPANKNTSSRQSKKDAENRQVILKLIQHLTGNDH